MAQVESPLVGRQAERALLGEALARAAGGQGTLLLISGEPGIGKSALCRAFADAVRGAGGRAFAGVCDEPGTATRPYAPFVDILHTLATAYGASALAAFPAH